MEQVQSYCYIGSKITEDGKRKLDIIRTRKKDISKQKPLTYYEQYVVRHKEKVPENIRIECNIMRMRDLNCSKHNREEKVRCFWKSGATGRCSRFHGATG